MHLDRVVLLVALGAALVPGSGAAMVRSRGPVEADSAVTVGP
jgi:hypothetical protein